MNILLWLAWAVFLSWLGRELFERWRKYIGLFDAIRHPLKLSPEFASFAYVIFAVLGSAYVRIFADQKNFYPKTLAGFANTGFTEAQLLCGFAWVLTLIYSMRWAVPVFLSHNSNTRWTLGSFYVIFILLGTSFVLHCVFQVPLGDGAKI